MAKGRISRRCSPVLATLFLFVSFTLQGCSAVLTYPTDWPAIMPMQKSGCPDITGTYQNLGKSQSGNKKYLFDTLTNEGIFGAHEHAGLFVKLEWVSSDQNNLLVTLLDYSGDVEQTLLNKTNGDFSCIDGALVVEFTEGMELIFEGYIDSGIRKFRLADDGSLVLEENSTYLAHFTFVIPVVVKSTSHTIWYRGSGRSRFYTFRELAQIVENAESRGDLITWLGTPVKEHESAISYMACQDSDEVEFVLNGIYYEAAYQENHVPTECFELILKFDNNHRLTSYKKTPIAALYYKTPEVIMADNIRLMKEQGIPDPPWRLYAEGGRKPEDVLWLCNAADIGHTFAQMELGRIYWRRNDISSNRSKSYMWYMIAAASNINNGIYRDESIQKRAQVEVEYKRETVLTEEQLINAVQLLLMWEPGQCERELIPDNSVN